VTEDLIGRVFGRLTVVEAADHYALPSGNKRGRYLAKCVCGKEKEVWGEHLKSGHTRSCGCLRGRPPGRRNINSLGPISRVIQRYKHQAKARGLCWEIGLPEFRYLTSQSCHYCGLPPSNKTKRGDEIFTYSGLDRKDNAVGYKTENVVPCCSICNRFKSKSPYESFIAYIDRVTKYRSGVLLNG
jgi:hypothetical protein